MANVHLGGKMNIAPQYELGEFVAEQSLFMLGWSAQSRFNSNE
jgi:hypothetical protein